MESIRAKEVDVSIGDDNNHQPNTSKKQEGSKKKRESLKNRNQNVSEREITDENGAEKHWDQQENVEQVEQGLVFIKDKVKKSKEHRSKKNKIINVTKDLFDDFDKSSVEIKKDKHSSSTSSSKKKENSSKEEKSSKDKKSSIVQQHHQIEQNRSKDRKDNGGTSSRKRQLSESTSKNPNQSCVLIHETIKLESNDDRIYICPICNKPDDGTPMICCDTCEIWYHYRCVGIFRDPEEDESWFCPPCCEKQAKNFEKFQKKKEKNRSKHQASNRIDQDEVTITKIPFDSGEYSGKISKRKIETSPLHSQQQTISGSQCRPRGRPRKDSTNASGGRESSITITPILPSTQFTNEAEIQKSRKTKEICAKCHIADVSSKQMIPCDNCHQWYHWECVGITNVPSPDSSWYCEKCNRKIFYGSHLWHSPVESKKRSEMSLEETPFRVGSSSKSSSKSSRKMMRSSRHETSPIPIDKMSSKTTAYANQYQENADWLCGTCKQTSVPIESSSSAPIWIACDECDVWYHLSCQNLASVPNDTESWFCNVCIQKQKSIEHKLQATKMKRKSDPNRMFMKTR